MLYVSKVCGNSIKVVDSESGDCFDVVKTSLGYKCGGKPFKMKKVLGYLSKNFVVAVDKSVIGLLRYIKSIDYTTSAPDYVLGGSGMRRISGVSSNNILFFLDVMIKQLHDGRRVHDPLDVILFASQDPRFCEALEFGKFGIEFTNGYIVIEFCGDYIGYVMKAVMLYRHSERFLSSVDLIGLV